MPDAKLDIETGTSDLLASRIGRVLVLTLNRPQVRNALSPEMLDALALQLEGGAVDEKVGCVVLTGATGAFCSGGDVGAMSATSATIGADEIAQQQRIQRQTAGKLSNFEKPTIAAINGPAAGAGLALALACDLRMMSSITFVTTAFGKVALPGDFGGAYLATKILGTACARELYLLSERIGATEALRIGLANRVYSPEELFGETMKLAERLGNGPALALKHMKQSLNRALVADMEECMDSDAANHIHCLDSADFQEASSAFLENRQPSFHNPS